MKRPFHLITVLYFGLVYAVAVFAFQPGTGAVAVWDVENLMPEVPANSDMVELLSIQVIEALKESNHTVVERERLALALQELKLGSSVLVDEATRLRIGKIVGAKYLVFGAFMVFGGTMRLDLRLVETETGAILKAVEKTTESMDPLDWMREAREAAQRLF
jgi:TolB-like protein